MHEHIDLAPLLLSFVEHCSDIARCGDISLNRNGLTTGRSDTRHHLLGLPGTGVIVDDYAETRSASTNAVAAPIPRLAPVITATRRIRNTSV